MTLEVDPGQLAAFTDALFRHADKGSFVSLRAFRDDVDNAPPVRITAVPMNGELGKVAEAATAMARYCATYPHPAVFCPPVATFGNAKEATEAALVNGLALSVELDRNAECARKRLEFLIGPATMVVASGGSWNDPETGEAQPKLHVHWRLAEPTRSPEAHARLKRARAMATALVGGDASNKPSVHPIRWPGSVHRKGEPKLCRIVAINPEAEIDLQAALGILLDIQPEFRNETLHGQAPGEGEDRETPELIRALLAGEDYHSTLLALSMRYLARGMAPEHVTLTLRGIMQAVPFERRDGDRPGRWQARYDDIPRTVRQGQEKHQQSAAQQQPQITEASTIMCQKVDWLWYPYLPANNLSLLGAKGGGGKGLTCAALAATVTTAGVWPNGTDYEKPEPGHVLWGETEDPAAEVLKPRLIAAGADCSKISFITPAGFAALDRRKFIRERGTRLIVLSPFMAFLKGLVNIGNELEVRAHLDKLLADLAGTGCALLGVAHANKKADLAAIERILGSVAFTNFVRSVLLIARNENEEASHRMVHAKYNLSGKGNDLLFTPRNVGEDERDQFVKLDWTAPTDGNVDTDGMFDRRKPPPARARSPSAMEWLLDYLTKHGESPREVVVSLGEQAGFKEEALEKAAFRCAKFQSRPEGFPARSWWSVR
jgi:AAA domain